MAISPCKSSRRNGKRIPQFTCSAYSKIPVGTRCSTQHRVNGDDVLELVKETLKSIIKFSQEDEEAFVKKVQETVATQHSADATEQKTRLTNVRKHLDELEVLICKSYEDNALGGMPESRYETLIRQYSKEQAELNEEIEQIENALAKFEEERKSGKG